MTDVSFQLYSGRNFPPLSDLIKLIGSLGYKEGDFPESERAARETLALPINPHLTPAMQEAVVGRIGQFFE